ncbi:MULTISPECIES: hypothetical protein [unclassified Paraburkholderia]|uniref:hypothetical protein n=1 Tax=unclassified Paraburkholderia TaxID=2615204 RepID=UPI002AB18F8A|nr:MULTISPECIES: hypothetical protein [unclassified Paraburkholderia]
MQYLLTASRKVRRELALLLPNWSWKIDGVLSAAILITLILDRTPIKKLPISLWINVAAIFCAGLLLHRYRRHSINNIDGARRFSNRFRFPRRQGD